ncbi:MAG: hypothetical protein R3C01_07995 [Planctomycetaceae bacterium]
MATNHQRALELARDGHWDAAHEIVQAGSDPLSCQIHGYLHRVEGDLSNARYWYNQAQTPFPNNTLKEEWQRLSDLIG